MCAGHGHHLGLLVAQVRHTVRLQGTDTVAPTTDTAEQPPVE
jgi:hypothetical protein